MSLTGNVSIRGFYSLGVKGNNFFADHRSRLSYTLMFQQKILDLWGVSYDACLVNPVSEYTRRTLRLETDYVYSLGMGMSLGAALNVNYTYVPQVLNPAYFDGGELSYVFAGLGLSVQYDTRDMILNPRRGMYVMVKEVFYPAVFSTYWLGAEVGLATLTPSR